VPVAEIQQNNYDLSINRYKEVIHEEKLYDHPEIIIQRMTELDEERAILMAELKDLLVNTPELV